MFRNFEVEMVLVSEFWFRNGFGILIQRCSMFRNFGLEMVLVSKYWFRNGPFGIMVKNWLWFGNDLEIAKRIARILDAFVNGDKWVRLPNVFCYDPHLKVLFRIFAHI